MRPRVVAVMPADNAARTIESIVAARPRELVHEVIVVDDGSRDGTPAPARRLGLQVIQQPRNPGYGMNQKTCAAEAVP